MRHRKNEVDRELEDWVAEARKNAGAALDLPTVMQACPEFASWAHNMGGYLRDWGDLHRVAGQLRPMIGVSEHAWNLAQDRLGPQIATAALVLTFDKHCAGRSGVSGRLSARYGRESRGRGAASRAQFLWSVERAGGLMTEWEIGVCYETY